MKSICFYLTLFLVVGLSSGLRAQDKAPCGYDLYHEHKMETDTDYARRYNIYKRNRKRVTAEDVTSTRNATGSYQIPIVVHIISNPGNPNTDISHDQIQSQIDRLNLEFTNPVGSGADMEIQFCLAGNTPDGLPWDDPSYGGDPAFPGITRISNANLSNHTDLNADALFNAHGFPSANYANIYVVEDITFDGNSGIAGYSSFDGSLGAVMIYTAFGDNENCQVGNCFNLLPNNDMGRVLVHEFGHFFSLMHPWGSLIFECQEDDMIDDTPIVLVPNTGCNPNTNSCDDGTPDPNDMVNNHMDYTNDPCRDAFTSGQRCAAHSFILSNPIVSSLISPNNLANTGVLCLDLSYLADIESTNGTQFCIDDQVDLAYTGNNEAGIDSWEFSVTNTTTGNSQFFSGTGLPIEHSFALVEEGAYSVQVIVTDDAYDPPHRTAVRSNYLYVSACDPVTCNQVWIVGTGQGVEEIFDFQSGSLNLTEAEAGDMAWPCNFSFNCSDDGFSYHASMHFIYNANGQLMAGGNHNPHRVNQSPAAIIGPPLLVNGEYYMFTTTGRRWDGGDPIHPLERGLVYYRIDPTANNNLGQVLSPVEGEIPSENYSISSEINAIPDCNGGYWIVVRAFGYDMANNYQAGSTPNIETTFLSYHLTSTGFVETPVISSVAGTTCDQPYRRFHSEVSPDGNWLAVVPDNCDNLIIYNFNRSTGQLSYVHDVSAPRVAGFPPTHTLSFSPSGNFLYLFDRVQDQLRQYNFEDFLECRTFDDPSTIQLNGDFHYIQAGSDGKLYLWSTIGCCNNNLSVINYPDNELTEDEPNAIGLNLGAIPLANGRTFTHAFPHYIEATSTSPEMTIQACVTDCGTVEVYAYGCDTPVTWDFGDGSATSTDNPAIYTYTLQPGANDFTISATDASGTVTQTAVSFTPPLIPNIFPDANLCDQLGITYSVEPYNEDFIYEWDINSSDVVSQGDGLGATEGVTWDDTDATGDITVTVTNPETGCFSIATYTQLPCTPCTEDLDFTVSTTPTCDEDGTITITMNNGSGNFAFIWSNNLPGSATQDGLAAGTYTFTIIDVTTTCEATGTATVGTDTGCGGNTCEIIGLQSPDAFCFEDDGTIASYYVNIHIPNWSSAGQPFDFSFCQNQVSTTGALSTDLETYVKPSSFAIEGFVYIASGQVNPEICFQVPVCLPDCSVCTGSFCFTFDPCEPECNYTGDPVIDYTYLGIPNPGPCGGDDEPYYAINIDWDVNVGNNDPYNVQLWSDLGPFCSSYNQNLTAVNGVLSINYSSDWATNGHHHLCTFIKIKNLVDYTSCIMEYCEIIDPNSVPPACMAELELKVTGSSSCERLTVVNQRGGAIPANARVVWRSPSQLMGSSATSVDITRYQDGTQFKAMLTDTRTLCERMLEFRTNCASQAIDCNHFAEGQGRDNKQTLAEELIISPNPFEEYVQINLPYEQTIRISIINIHGQEMLTLPYRTGAHFNLDLSELPAGVYYCSVQESGKHAPIIKPLVKM